MLNRLRQRREDEGFTLIELLVVIIILAVLAAIVVFAVGGINNDSKSSACKSDKKTLQTAEEAYYATNNQYTDSGNLKPKFLADDSVMYTATATGGGTGYTISPISGNPNGCT